MLLFNGSFQKASFIKTESLFWNEENSGFLHFRKAGKLYLRESDNSNVACLYELRVHGWVKSMLLKQASG